MGDLRHKGMFEILAGIDEDCLRYQFRASALSNDVLAGHKITKNSQFTAHQNTRF